MSSHRLCIEAGRWNRPHPTPREQRLCTVCNQLEDEYHLLFECSLYNDERVAYLKPYYLRNKSMFKAVELMQENNSNILKKWRCISTNVLKYVLMRYYTINTIYAHMFGFLNAI